MFCSNCGTKIEESDKFCKKCGQEQSLIMADNEKVDENKFSESDNYYDDIDDIENQTQLISSDDPQVVPLEKESFFKKIFKGVGIGGLVVVGGLLSSSFAILQFLFVAFAGLSTIGRAILLFSEGSIIWGLVTLFIGTPMAIGLAYFFFLPLLILALVLTILTLIVGLGLFIFGFDVSFSNVWDGIWLVIKVLILGSMAFFGISSFVEAVENKDVISFFKENWFYILFFCFLFWLFFL